MIKRVLIANRGEIARRIARTCRRMSVDHVAVYSEADCDAPHLNGATARVAIGPAAASRSYLDGDRLIQAALETGCDAVHPGYGFLSENAGFAAAVEAAGLVFVGPAPATIAAMGDKARAKAFMQTAGVPTVPGSAEASDQVDAITAMLEQIGYPALLKPVAGGGGKGMAAIEDGDGRDEISSAIRTARSSFGDGRLLVERLVRRPRHIEVQIFGDGRGDAVHMFERECSLQRRHQKVVEEAPAANLPQTLRDAITEAALRGARALSYRNAGTFEFIIDEDGAFYFLEVNTRLQVEHPVTEAITGIDLVEWQLRVASGESLPLTQEEIAFSGHAVECRIYAEDPSAGFLPSPGRVTAAFWPRNARIESGVEVGTVVPPDYDPMIAKLIVHGADRAAAIGAMQTAISETAIVGVTTNLGFLDRLLRSPCVMEGHADTDFIDGHTSDLVPVHDPIDVLTIAAAAIAYPPALRGPHASPWQIGPLHDRTTLDPDAPLGRISLLLDGQRRTVFLLALNFEEAVLESFGNDGMARRRIAFRNRDQEIVSGRIHAKNWQAVVAPRSVDLILQGTRVIVGRVPEIFEAGIDGGETAAAQMPGVLVAVSVSVGDVVTRGDVLAVVEAMKFENPIVATRSGVVAEVACAVGDQVHVGQPLFRISDGIVPSKSQ
jgi:propionyl-CoA carboxylase alpha chain/3-methylcrotonyl-CoA carboxylase alpha subunit